MKVGQIKINFSYSWKLQVNEWMVPTYKQSVQLCEPHRCRLLHTDECHKQSAVENINVKIESNLKFKLLFIYWVFQSTTKISLPLPFTKMLNITYHNFVYFTLGIPSSQTPILPSHTLSGQWWTSDILPGRHNHSHPKHTSESRTHCHILFALIGDARKKIKTKDLRFTYVVIPICPSPLCKS